MYENGVKYELYSVPDDGNIPAGVILTANCRDKQNAGQNAKTGAQSAPDI